MKRLILIGGTMGVGKTSTSSSLQEILQPSVWLDGDWCWKMNPWNFSLQNKQMVMDNICYLLNNYISNDYFQYIIFSWVMHKQVIINNLLKSLDLKNVIVHNFSLICGQDSLLHRMQNDNRSIDVIENSLSNLSLYKDLNTIKINTDNLSINEVAQIIKKHVKKNSN